MTHRIRAKSRWSCFSAPPDGSGLVLNLALSYYVSQCLTVQRTGARPIWGWPYLRGIGLSSSFLRANFFQQSPHSLQGHLMRLFSDGPWHVIKHHKRIAKSNGYVLASLLAQSMRHMQGILDFHGLVSDRVRVGPPDITGSLFVDRDLPLFSLITNHAQSRP